jgi:benzoate/toluate 1,2-dioxygenase beta subunit
VTDIREIEAFLLQEAHLLDERRFEEWMALFTEDGFYWAPARSDQEDPLNSVSLIFDDREAMATRIRRLRHPRIHVQTPPSRTARIVANVFVESASPERAECVVRSKFLIYEDRPSLPEALERIFAGTYHHRLLRRGSGFRIASKKATLANCDAALGPIAVYF